jgi:branched-subunit amino acid aminotransferase/4-amino-4-deoxychorismate lyase
LTVTPGNPDQGDPPQVFLLDRAVPYTEVDYENGFAVVMHDEPRSEKSPLARHKTGNQMENLLAWRSARLRGFDEAVFLNTRGFVAEGTRSNVFMVSGNRVVTPPVEAGILPGLARERTLMTLREMGLDASEQNITWNELRNCDECFLTNSIMQAMPVKRIGDVALATRTGVAPSVRARLIEEAERALCRGMKEAAC